MRMFTHTSMLQVMVVTRCGITHNTQDHAGSSLLFKIIWFLQNLSDIAYFFSDIYI